jgi:hypothetical protein
MSLCMLRVFLFSFLRTSPAALRKSKASLSRFRVVLSIAPDALCHFVLSVWSHEKEANMTVYRRLASTQYMVDYVVPPNVDVSASAGPSVCHGFLPNATP